MKFAIEEREGYLEAVLSGPAGLRAFREFLDSIFERESWVPGTNILVDQTKLDTSQLSTADLRVMADLCIARGAEVGAGKLGLLAGRDLEYGIGRMWSVFVDRRWSRAVKVFRSREDAVAWLTVRCPAPGRRPAL